MTLRMKSPARGQPRWAGEEEAFCRRFENTEEDKRPRTQSQSFSPAIVRLMRNFRLSYHTAKTVAELARLGPEGGV